MGLSNFFKSLFQPQETEPKVVQLEDDVEKPIYETPYSQSVKFDSWSKQRCYDRARLVMKTGDYGGLGVRPSVALQKCREEFSLSLPKEILEPIVAIAVKDYMAILTQGAIAITSPNCIYGYNKKTYYKGEL